MNSNRKEAFFLLLASAIIWLVVVGIKWFLLTIIGIFCLIKLISYLHKTHCQKEKDRELNFLKEYFPVSYEKLYYLKENFFLSYHSGKEPFKISKIFSLSFGNQTSFYDCSDQPFFAFYFNEVKDSLIMLFIRKREIHVNDIMEITLEKGGLSCIELCNRIDKELYNSLVMYELHDKAIEQNKLFDKEKSADKTLKLLGL